MSRDVGRVTKVVVTGAAGFIGSHLVRRLVAEHGTEVVGIDNERSGDWSRVAMECIRVERDIVDMTFDEMIKTLRGADYLFHLAAEKYNSSKSTPEAVIETNIVATHRLFEAAAAAGVGKVVFTSSLYAYGSLGPDVMQEGDALAPTTMYGMSKAAGEDLLRVVERDHGTTWAVARLFFIYGTDQYAEGGYRSVIISNFERLLRGEEPTVYGSGEQELDYVYIDDCVDALLALASDPESGLIVNVSSGHGWAINELTDLMLEVAGSDLQPVGAPADWTEGSRRVGSNERIHRDIGWIPRIGMHEGLSRVWDWMEENHV